MTEYAYTGIAIGGPKDGDYIQSHNPTFKFDNMSTRKPGEPWQGAKKPAPKILSGSYSYRHEDGTKGVFIYNE